ncbi:MAG: enoyl-CoA hydratase/isomerase family protein [Oligoflexus sp.]
MYVTLLRQANHFLLCLDRPERMNGLGTTIGLELLASLERLTTELAANDLSQRLLVLTAKAVQRKDQKNIWIAGGDLKELAALTTPTQGDEYSQLYRQICQLLEDLPIPVLIAIDGQAIGGGVELCLAGDIRLATTTSTFSFKQVQMGLATGYGGCRRLVETVGRSLAQHWLLLGQTIDATRAVHSGLVHEVLPNSEALQKRWEEIADYFSTLSYQALQQQKKMLHAAVKLDRDRALETERELFAELWMSQGHRQALDRFTKKR